jgi:hypothetical protein
VRALFLVVEAATGPRRDVTTMPTTILTGTSPTRRGRLAGAAALAAPLACLGALAAGCGGSGGPGVANIGTTSAGGAATTGTAPASTAPAPSRASKAAASYAFSTCMRTHGVPDFPYPGPHGGIQVTPGTGIDPSSPQFQSAQHDCQHLIPAGPTPTPAQLVRQRAQLLRFVACMRSHGEPNLPDPSFSGGSVNLNLGSHSGVDPSSPQFQAAQRACQADLPGKPVTTGGAGGGGQNAHAG